MQTTEKMGKVALCGIAFVFPANNKNVSNIGLQLLGK